MVLSEPRWSNCLTWALRQLRREGGYILFRHGRNGFPFHVLWSPDHVRVWHYSPIEPIRVLASYFGTNKDAPWWLVTVSALFLLRFRGEVVEGDDVVGSGGSPHKPWYGFT